MTYALYAILCFVVGMLACVSGLVVMFAGDGMVWVMLLLLLAFVSLIALIYVGAKYTGQETKKAW